MNSLIETHNHKYNVFYPMMDIIKKWINITPTQEIYSSYGIAPYRGIMYYSNEKDLYNDIGYDNCDDDEYNL